MTFLKNTFKPRIVSYIVTLSVLTVSLNAKANTADDFFEVVESKTEVIQISDGERERMLKLMGNMHMSCQDSNISGIFDTGSVSPLTPFVETTKDANEIVKEGNEIVDGLINIGSKIWSIVKAGKPVVNINIGPSANALPRGVKCWDELIGWETPTVFRTKTSLTNPYGFALAEFQFDVIFTHGGSVNGVGKYLTHVQVFPSDVYTFWMQELNASVEVASITNASKVAGDPVAAMQVDVKWQMKNFLNEVNQTASIYVRADGYVKPLY